jgi:diacylglycerol kinase (ATP)
MKLLRSFTYAWSGIKTCFSAEANFKIHIVFAIAAITLGFLLNISHNEWLAIIVCIAFVMTMEMINTAIEKLCDVVQPGIDPRIKKVKDIAAGAVLVAAMGSLITGAVIFLPKIIILIKSL